MLGCVIVVVSCVVAWDGVIVVATANVVAGVAVVVVVVVVCVVCVGVLVWWIPDVLVCWCGGVLAGWRVGGWCVCVI